MCYVRSENASLDLLVQRGVLERNQRHLTQKLAYVKRYKRNHEDGERDGL